MSMNTKYNPYLTLTIIAFVLSTLSICILCLFFFTYNTPRHTLYIGTNDKDTLQAEILPDEARGIIVEICSRHSLDYTVAGAQGVWTNAAGEAAAEDTLILIIYGASDKAISELCRDIALALNQESVLIEKAYTNAYFFDTLQASK